MKTKTICLVGASGSGKTTIANKLKELDKNINVIQSYTTRKPRYEGEIGHTFIDDMQENQLDDNKMDLISKLGGKIEVKIISKKDMIAYFNSYKSDNQYFALDNQVIRGKINIYVVDPAGAEQVKEYYKVHNNLEQSKWAIADEAYKMQKVEVITVYLAADEEERVTRMIYRKVEDIQANKKVVDVGERLKSDKEIFKSVKCDYCIDSNRTIEEVANDVIEVII